MATGMNASRPGRSNEQMRMPSENSVHHYSNGALGVLLSTTLSIRKVPAGSSRQSSERNRR